MSSENKLAGSKRNTRKHRRQSTRKKTSGHGYIPRHARCRITTRPTQNNSVTVMQTLRRNPSMQNRTILIQCDRALSGSCPRAQCQRWWTMNICHSVVSCLIFKTKVSLKRRYFQQCLELENRIKYDTGWYIFFVAMLNSRRRIGGQLTLV